MKFIVWSLFFLLAPSVMIAQKSEPSISTEGKCNGVASGANITVIVNCNTLRSQDDAQKLAKQYATILERIQHEQLSFAQVNAKLDSIKVEMDAVRDAEKPRHLTESQIKKLTSLSLPHPNPFANPGEALLIMSAQSDAEAISYSEDFKRGLINSANFRDFGVFRRPYVGLIYFTSSTFATVDRVPSYCRELLSFLVEEKLPFTQEVKDFDVIGASGVAVSPCGLIVGIKM